MTRQSYIWYAQENGEAHSGEVGLTREAVIEAVREAAGETWDYWRLFTADASGNPAEMIAFLDLGKVPS